MASFGWKRKVGSCVLKEAVQKFESESRGDDEAAIDNGEVDWLSLAPKRRCLQLEDAVAKSARLRQEGITLAEAERFWEAILKWDEALLLTSNDATLYEMKAQALMSLGEVFPAVSAAEKATLLDKKWWIAHQTLGRAFLGLGEVKMALKCFSRAVHINPADDDLRQEDLMWALELYSRKLAVDKQVMQVTDDIKHDVRRPVSVVELVSNQEQTSELTLYRLQSAEPTCAADAVVTDPSADDTDQSVLQRLPANYVAMRD